MGMGRRVKKHPHCLLIAALLVGAAEVAPAVPADAAAEGEVLDVIMRQLDAFRAGDYRTAYSFASRMIQAQFDLAAFEHMVKNGYPQIARSTHAWVTEARPASNGALHVFLRIRGADGTFIRALYEMVREEPGWRINGVVTRPDPETV